MKKISTLFLSITIVLGGLLYSPQVAAQHKVHRYEEPSPTSISSRLPHRIGVSYSDGIYSLGGIVGRALLMNILGADIENINGFGGINVGYNFVSQSERWSYGASIGYMPIEYIQNIKGKKQSFSEYVISIMPEVQCFYTRGSLVRLYGSASIGLGLILGVGEPEYSLDWQINPIGVRIGSNRVAGFLSLGVGTRGFVNVGVQVGL